jgi:hypothetical protein
MRTADLIMRVREEVHRKCAAASRMPPVLVNVYKRPTLLVNVYVLHLSCLGYEPLPSFLTPRPPCC